MNCRAYTGEESELDAVGVLVHRARCWAFEAVPAEPIKD